MTVAELIEQLRHLPPDAVVWCEGCDHVINPAVEAVLEELQDGDFVALVGVDLR